MPFLQTISDSNLTHIKDLYYKKQYSQSQIAQELGVSIDAVVYVMRKHSLVRRTKKEQSQVRFFNKKPSFSLKQQLSVKDQILKSIGVTLYWGEGYKTGLANAVDFANSDIKMIQLFLRFLRKICGIDETRLRVYVYCYSNQNPPELIRFWSKITGIPKSQFTKPYVRKDFRLEKKDKMPYGLVHIRYSDKKLLLLIKEWIEECKQILDDA